MGRQVGGFLAHSGGHVISFPAVCTPHPAASSSSPLLFCPRMLCMCVQVDWDKWVDEDEEEEGDDKMGGFDLSQLQNFAVSGCSLRG